MQIPNIDDVNTTEELAKFIETVEKIQDAYLNNLRRERGMEPDSDLSEAMIRSTPLSIIPEFTPRIFGLSVNHDELQHSTLNIRCTRWRYSSDDDLANGCIDMFENSFLDVGNNCNTYKKGKWIIENLWHDVLWKLADGKYSQEIATEHWADWVVSD